MAKCLQGGTVVPTYAYPNMSKMTPYILTLFLSIIETRILICKTVSTVVPTYV